PLIAIRLGARTHPRIPQRNGAARSPRALRGRDNPKQRLLVRRHSRRRLRTKKRRPHFHKPDRFALARKQPRPCPILSSPECARRSGRPGAMERQMGGATRRLPLVESQRPDGDQNEPAVSRPPINPQPPSRRPPRRPEYRSHAASKPPGAARRKTRAPLAGNPRLRPARHHRDEHRLLHRLHHDVPRAGHSRRSLPPCLNLFWRSRFARPNDDERMGADETIYLARGGDPLLVADQPLPVYPETPGLRQKNPNDNGELRSDVLARINGAIFGRIAPKQRQTRAFRAPVRPLLARSNAL